MSKYNSYARALEAAFMKARGKYVNAFENLENAQEQLKVANRSYAETFWGERASKIAKAQAQVKVAQADFDCVRVAAWSEFEAEKKLLTEKLKAAVQNDCIVTPEAIDNNTIELLKSGICSPDDMESLATRYDGNSTMLKLISKYALDAAQNSADNVVKAKFNIIADNTREGNAKALKKWDELSSMCEILSGKKHTRVSHEYIAAISGEWEELAAPVVQDF